ncbi:hypothetical protein TSUD_333380 [Trifolium subterraneum]|uniref:C2H2-type domain-containing protein n=1 Tax=Trifolium subterraneum TaxID=3900 RepID=A0A2Z6N3W5_TRISU|nr:hypothetical protein TSUD_333380 [Trifolium subterraneum]
MGNCSSTDDSASMEVGSRFFACDSCNRKLNTKKKLKAHKKSTHPNAVYPCSKCKVPVGTKDERNEHYNKMECSKKD